MADEKLMRDPYRGYSRIREEAPLVRAVMPGVEPVWLATRYDDIKMVLNDPRFVINAKNVPGMDVPSLREQILRGVHGTPEEYVMYRTQQMGAFDGAELNRLRGVVSPEFSRRKIERLRPRIAEIAESALDGLAGAATDGVADLMAHYAYPLSGTVLCELVGIPEADRERWHGLYMAVWAAGAHDKTAGWRDLVGYIQELMERRRAEPGEDLLSGLVRAQREMPGRISDTEIIALVVAVGLAGRQNTADLIGSGTVALLTHPDQIALLRGRPELMPRAVHELLRYCTPSHVARMRYATEDLEIGGVPVRKGEAVRPVLVSGNYDPREFPAPERLDITREPDGRFESHVTFSYGPHYCLGAALARLEGEIAFDALLCRHPNLSLDCDPADLDYETMPGQWRILTALPVRL
ncbi:MAG: cytochrome P450 [Streptosporangiales bacterium]|nr:cytochrome P450 [Streptosporangiales bacterium]